MTATVHKLLLLCALSSLLLGSLAGVIPGNQAPETDPEKTQPVSAVPTNPVAPQDSTQAETKTSPDLTSVIANSLDVTPLFFLPAFFASISMIIVSELGDKTFFIAAIMAMRHNRFVIFTAAICALGLMTVLSAAVGLALPSILPREYTHMASILLFIFFGFRLLREAYYMSADEPNEELQEVESELEKKELDASGEDVGKLEAGTSAVKAAFKEDAAQKDKFSKFWQSVVSPVFIECFTMTFLAEWGDRSQITTIALAAAKNPFGVTIGGIIGHAFCTGLAVIGGKLLATRISERTVNMVGGVLFLFFAAHGVITGE